MHLGHRVITRCFVRALAPRSSRCSNALHARGFLHVPCISLVERDNPKGWVQRGKPGVQAPNPRLAKHRAAIAANPPVRFDAAQRLLLVERARIICDNLKVRIHGVSATPTHVHVLASWRDARALRAISSPLKQKLGRDLSKRKGSPGHRWFSRGCDEECVTDREHFDYLLAEYLTKHLRENGVIWREVEGLSTG
jgi:hypothetical protein